ncbi:MAG: TylF/MycF/NovP-related O-methyltransferase [Candidatus Korobacteraceae bacterium]
MLAREIRMTIRRRFANFSIKSCGLRKLHDGKAQRLIRAVLDEIDLQHVRDTYPCGSFRDRAEMYQYVHESRIRGEAMDYLEFGVFQGDSMRQWVTLNKHKDSRFFGFDSFEGLPEDWRAGQARGHFDVGGAAPPIDDLRVKFVKGWFEDTIPPFVRDFTGKNRLLLHLDADLYRSTILPLVHFNPFMSKGTLLIFDEFYDRDHEFKALMDWQKLSKRNFRVVAEMENYGRICAELI